MLQFLLSSLTNYLEPPADLILAQARCSVRRLNRTIETHGQELNMCSSPWGNAIKTRKTLQLVSILADSQEETSS